MTLESNSTRERLNIVLAGHVDHGKSTIVGRLLADTGSLPDGKLEQVRALCERNSKPFEYAFLIDTLRDERSQGITIDTARVFFETSKRPYLLFDAPGHIEFLKNLVTGASRADAALLVIDAFEGIQENSKRHGYLMTLLGVKQLAVLVNKMDLVGYKQSVFGKIVDNYSAFLKEAGLLPLAFVPVSGMQGDNVASRSDRMAWYSGSTVVEALDSFKADSPPANLPFRMPVQDVYKFTKDGDARRIVAGTVESGMLRPGDEVIFLPSGKKSRIKTIEAFGSGPLAEVHACAAAGFTLTEQVYVTRGEIATKVQEQKPHVTSRLRVSLFWLGRRPLEKGKDYVLKLGTARVSCRIEKIHRIINASDLSVSHNGRGLVERNEAAECDLQLKSAIAFDQVGDVPATSRFVLVDAYDMQGGGIALQALPDEQELVREKVLLRNFKWEKSAIPAEERAARFQQRPALVVITGGKDTGKKKIARALESQLDAKGNFAYFLGIGNVLYGVDADIKGKPATREEHIRRLGEVAHILLDAGFLLIVTGIELTRHELEVITMSIRPDAIETIWVGDRVTTDIDVDLHLADSRNLDDAVQRILDLLRQKQVLVEPNHPTKGRHG